MNGEDLKILSGQYARLDEALKSIHETQARQEEALIELFKGSRETSATIASLDTVVRMSLAEQKRINQGFSSAIKKLEGAWDNRGRTMERKLAYFAGGLAVFLVFFDLSIRYILKLV